MRITTKLSPNRSQRRVGSGIDLVIIHGTAGTDAGDEAWVLNPAAQVSYHWHVKRTGDVTLFVPEDMRAWHAGVSRWGDQTDLNHTSIGIGFSNRVDGKEFYTDAQYESGGLLLRQVMDRYSIPLDRVLPHSIVSPGRRTDPGHLFNWGALFKHAGF